MSNIAAISTPIGAGGIGIVRVSGNEALHIADAIFNFKSGERKEDGMQPWEPLKMHYGTFAAKEFKDNGYAVFFPAKKAYTGEDTVEFYLHGGVRILEGALKTLLENGAVLADRGEFTKRAFLSGRLSLADAEGVIDMINAESAAAVRAAYRLMDGELSGTINGLSDELGELIAGLEAALDYPDEMEDEVLPSLPKALARIAEKLDSLIESYSRGKIVKHGINVALAGRVNAGKSSLLNAMLKEERAIVTDVAGTTRDVVEAALEYDGVRINLFDTAGLRDSDDTVEAEGIERARKAAKNADLVLHVIDKTAGISDGLEFDDAPVFTVFNKCDEGGFAIPRLAYAFAISAKSGEGVEELKRAIVEFFRRGKTEGGDLITNERHYCALLEARRAVKSAAENADMPTDCILIDLRAAYDSLGQITGRSASVDVVDRIFSKFCVGK